MLSKVLAVRNTIPLGDINDACLYSFLGAYKLGKTRHVVACISLLVIVTPHHLVNLMQYSIERKTIVILVQKNTFGCTGV